MLIKSGRNNGTQQPKKKNAWKKKQNQGTCEEDGTRLTLLEEDEKKGKDIKSRNEASQTTGRREG